jgi:putative solute:sodium symporter small subunit
MSKNHNAYWKKNVSLMLKLLAIWFIASFGMGVLFVDYLNQFQFFGFPFGFWMAQQGAIYVFVVLIFVYVKKMNTLDKKHGVDEGDE